jgi:flagellar biogenesis protein FliO
MITVLSAVAAQPVCAAEPFPATGTRQSLEFRLSANEPAPFIEIDTPTSLSDATVSAVPPTPGSTPATAEPAHESNDEPESASDSPAGSTRESSLAETRRDLAELGRNDVLMEDVMRLAKWTMVTLILGVSAVLVIKKYNISIASPATGGANLKLLESLPLGRQMGMHLVEAGSDRFLVATDQAGIKTVTMLANWPEMPGENEAATDRTQRGPATTEWEERVQDSGARIQKAA